MVNNFVVSTIENLLQDMPHHYSVLQARKIADKMVFEGELVCLAGDTPCNCASRNHMNHPLNNLAFYARHTGSLLVIKVNPHMKLQGLIDLAFQQVTKASREDKAVCFLFEHHSLLDCSSQNLPYCHLMLHDFLALFRHVRAIPLFYTFHKCMGEAQCIHFISQANGRWLKMSAHSVTRVNYDHDDHGHDMDTTEEGELYLCEVLNVMVRKG